MGNRAYTRPLDEEPANKNEHQEPAAKHLKPAIYVNKPRRIWIKVDSFTYQDNSFWTNMLQQVSEKVEKLNYTVNLIGTSTDSKFGAASLEKIANSEHTINTVAIFISSNQIEHGAITAVNAAADVIIAQLGQPDKTIVKHVYGCIIYKGTEKIESELCS